MEKPGLVNSGLRPVMAHRRRFPPAPDGPLIEVLRPLTLQVGAGDFALAAGHRRTLRAVARRPEIAGGALSLAGSRLRRCRPLTDGAGSFLAKYS